MKGWSGPVPVRLRVRSVACALALAFAAPAGAVESAIIVSPAASAAAEMAYGIGVDGTTVAIGAPGENDVAGAAYVADCSTLPCGVPLRIAPAELVAGDAFGTALGISGNTLVVSAAGAVPGAAYVFVSDGVGWSQQAKLTPSGLSAGERFGQAVSLSGDRVAIGAGRVGVNGTGAVYVFVRNGTVWTEEAKLTPSDGEAFDAFGTSVALDVDTILVGAPMSAASVGAYANGAVYAYVRGAGGWTEQAKLTAAGANGDLFGYSVALSGDRTIIGAPYAANAQGQAYVFERSGSAWSQQAILTTAAGAAGDEFGWSVALGDDSIFVGAPFVGQANGVACGTSYAFDAATLGQAGGTMIGAPAADELAGWAVAASGQRWVTSAPGHLVGDIAHAGAAYWFDPAITIFHAGFDAPGACVAPGNVSTRIAR